MPPPGRCVVLCVCLLVCVCFVPADVEAHKGWDGRVYVLDLARCMPAEFEPMGVARAPRIAQVRHRMCLVYLNVCVVCGSHAVLTVITVTVWVGGLIDGVGGTLVSLVRRMARGPSCHVCVGRVCALKCVFGVDTLGLCCREDASCEHVW